jgi:hypothetical protein
MTLGTGTSEVLTLGKPLALSRIIHSRLPPGRISQGRFRIFHPLLVDVFLGAA